LDGRAGGGT